MIRCEKGQQYYEKLKNHKIYGVRVALAKKGVHRLHMMKTNNTIKNG